MQLSNSKAPITAVMLGALLVLLLFATGCNSVDPDFERTSTHDSKSPDYVPHGTYALSIQSVDGFVRLRWSTFAEHEDGFIIMKGSGTPLQFRVIGTVGAGVETFNDTTSYAGLPTEWRVQVFVVREDTVLSPEYVQRRALFSRIYDLQLTKYGLTWSTSYGPTLLPLYDIVAEADTSGLGAWFPFPLRPDVIGKSIKGLCTISDSVQVRVSGRVRGENGPLVVTSDSVTFSSRHMYVPPQPGLHRTADGLKLTWQDVSACDETYTVLRSVDDSPFEAIATVLNETSYIDPDIRKNTTYRYALTSTLPGGTSAPSRESTYRLDIPPPQLHYSGSEPDGARVLALYYIIDPDGGYVLQRFRGRTAEGVPEREIELALGTERYVDRDRETATAYTYRLIGPDAFQQDLTIERRSVFRKVERQSTDGALIYAIAYDEVGSRLTTVGGIVNTRDVETGVTLNTVALRESTLHFPKYAAMSGDRNVVAFVYISEAENRAILWDAVSGIVLNQIDFQGGTDVALNRAGDLVALWTEQGVEVRRVGDGTRVRTIPVTPVGYENHLALSPDGKEVAAGVNRDGSGGNHEVNNWRIDDGALVESFPVPLVRDLAYEPSGRFLIADSDSGLVVQDRPSNGAPFLLRTSGRTTYYPRAAPTASEDGSIFVTVRDDNVVTWRKGTNGYAAHTQELPYGYPAAFAVHPSRPEIAVASNSRYLYYLRPGDGWFEVAE